MYDEAMRALLAKRTGDGVHVRREHEGREDVRLQAEHPHVQGLGPVGP